MYGEFTVKYLYKREDRVKLVPANPTCPAITFREGQQLIVVGVVTATIKPSGSEQAMYELVDGNNFYVSCERVSPRACRAAR